MRGTISAIESIADVEKWHGTLQASGLGAGTVRNVHTVLTRALRDAVRHGVIARSVAGRDGETAPTYAPEEMKIIGKDELGDVVAKLRKHRICAEGMLALFCGLRAGEVLALRWDAVNLDDKLLHVRHTVLEIKGQALTTKDPKTKAGRRALTLPDVVVDVLRDLRRRGSSRGVLRSAWAGRKPMHCCFPAPPAGCGGPAPCRTSGGMRERPTSDFMI